MKDKDTPTYDLDSFKSALCNPNSVGECLTYTVMLDAHALGFLPDTMVATIQSMARQHFYKSTRSDYDASVWQDVYHVPSEVGVLYIKFRADVLTEFRLLSFKKR